MLASTVLQARRLVRLKEVPDPVPPACSPNGASPFLPRELAQSVGTGIPLAQRNPVASKATWEEPNAAVHRTVERWLARHVSGGDQPLSASYCRRRTTPGSPLRQERRSGCRPQARHLEPALRRQGRLRVPLVRDQDGGPHPGRQHRPDEGGAEVRRRQGHPPHLLCRVVDPRLHPELYFEELEPGEAR